MVLLIKYLENLDFFWNEEGIRNIYDVHRNIIFLKIYRNKILYI